MPSEQHEQWKHELFSHLDRKVSGCISCDFGHSREDHLPSHRGTHREPSQEIMWTCERMHPHTYDVLRGAGYVEMEKYQSAPESGRCCPDLTVLNTHREPTAFIEVVRSNRPSNSLRVAEELGIPLFTILAPHGRSLRPGLHPSRPWWDFDPNMPDEAKREMYFMEEVADELMHRHQEGDSTWSELDLIVDEDGSLAFASLRSSPPDLCGPTFPRAGDLIVAELCSWNCDEVMEIQARERAIDEQYALVSVRQQLEQNLGRIIFGAIHGSKHNAASFVVPVGSEEVHVQMSLRPLNGKVDPDDPTVLNLVGQLQDAVDTVRNRYARR